MANQSVLNGCASKRRPARNNGSRRFIRRSPMKSWRRLPNWNLARTTRRFREIGAMEIQTQRVFQILLISNQISESREQNVFPNLLPDSSLCLPDSLSLESDHLSKLGEAVLVQPLAQTGDNSLRHARPFI